MKAFEWKQICVGLFSFHYIWMAIGDPINKRWWVGIPLSSLFQPHFCACSKTGPVFPNAISHCLFMFNEISWEVIVCFVDIGGIVDHHCLYFLLFCWYWWYSRLHLIANRLIAKFVLLQKKLKHRSIYHSFNVKTRG